MDQREKDFQQKLLAIFRVEAAEHLQMLSSGLVELEAVQSADDRMKIIETLFREVHSLKGAARAVGLNDMESVCHAAESLLAALKRGEQELSPALFDVLHDTADELGRLLAADDKAPTPPHESTGRAVIHRLHTALKADPAPAPAPAPETKTKTKTKAPVQDQARQAPRPHPPAEQPVLASTVRVATARLEVLLFQAEELLSAKLTAAQHAAELRQAVNELARLNQEHARIAPVRKACQQAWERQPVTEGREAKAPRGGVARAVPPPRVLLDFMAAQASDLKSLQSMLGTLAKSAEHDHRSLATMVNGLLDDMKQVLLLPIASAFELFPKMVRDLSRALGKEVELVVTGGEVEIDRRILEQLRDPLTHLVRNCIDHGIETADARQAANKPPRGCLTITTTQKGGNKIEIVVSDDGAGIDLSRVRAAARKLGLAAPDDSDSPALLPLVFQSGLSTAPILTDLSGRGLGLAIVQEKVEGLGGIITVETQLGRGTAFRIALPLTLATLRGVQVRVNHQDFVLPSTHVEQGLRLKRATVKTVGNRATIPWNGEAVALVHLADVLAMPRIPGRAGAAALTADDRPNDTLQVLLLGAASQRIAFEVDEVVSEQEVLVKPLGRQLAHVRNIAGATVLGSGKAVPILNVADLLRSAVKAAAAPGPARVDEQAAAVKTPAILVAEDSITSRTLLQGILESAGYRVATAVDGADGFARLKTEHFDLVVSDVEMPRMNGFDLTARIRADPALAQLPVILVTSLESREHRELGIDAGANAYIVKSSFDQSNLLETIRRLL